MSYFFLINYNKKWNNNYNHNNNILINYNNKYKI